MSKPLAKTEVGNISKASSTSNNKTATNAKTTITLETASLYELQTALREKLESDAETSSSTKKTSSRKSTKTPRTLATASLDEIKAALSRKIDEESNPRKLSLVSNMEPHQRKDGRFQKGQSGNRAGRPPGSRNKLSLRVLQLVGDDVEHFLGIAKEKAGQGDTRMLQLLLKPFLPKERTITLDLTPTKGPMDLPITVPTVLAAMGRGEITPPEAEKISDTISAHYRHVEARARYGHVLEKREAEKLALDSVDLPEDEDET